MCPDSQAVHNVHRQEASEGNYIKLHIILIGIIVQLLSGMRVFVHYNIIMDQNWTIHTYVSLVLKKSTTYILYNPSHFCEELVYVLK